MLRERQVALKLCGGRWYQSVAAAAPTGASGHRGPQPHSKKRCGGLRPLAAAGAVALLVLSAALRSPAVVSGVPRLAVSAVVLTLLLYAGALLGALLAPGPVSRPLAAEESQPDRLAA